jgi:hypothetical protein
MTAGGVIVGNPFPGSCAATGAATASAARHTHAALAFNPASFYSFGEAADLPESPASGRAQIAASYWRRSAVRML